MSRNTYESMKRGTNQAHWGTIDLNPQHTSDTHQAHTTGRLTRNARDSFLFSLEL